MFELVADKTQLKVRELEPITSGSVNVYYAWFSFSDDWDGLNKTAVFQAGCKTCSVLLEDNGDGRMFCMIPWEALERPGCHLFAGVYGTGADGTVVLPTVWANLGPIWEGAVPAGENARPPTPDLWRQELDKKADRLDYTETGELGLYAGDKVLSSVPVESGTDFIPGDGLNKNGDIVSVTIPVRGSFTQAEFDALPEAQRGRGLFVISDHRTILIYNTNGDGVVGMPGQHVIYGSSDYVTFKISSKIPQRYGYQFLGWSPSKSGPQILYPGNSISAPAGLRFRLYAVWGRNAKIIYKPGENAVGDDYVDERNGISVYTIKSFGSVGFTAKDGCQFLFWNDGSGDVYEPGDEINTGLLDNGELILTARCL